MGSLNLINSNTAHSLVEKLVAKVQHLQALHLHQMLTLLAVLQMMATIGLNVALVAENWEDCMVQFELGASTLVILFVAYFAVEAVRTENQYQLMSYLVLSTILLPLYISPLAGRHGWHGGRILSIVAIVTTGILYLLNVTLALVTYLGTGDLVGFGWRVYKKVGADPVLIDCYRRYQQFCSALKLRLK